MLIILKYERYVYFYWSSRIVGWEFSVWGPKGSSLVFREPWELGAGFIENTVLRRFDLAAAS